MWPEFLLFLVSMVFCAGLLILFPRLGDAMGTFARSSEVRAFPSSSPYEYNKFALLRIFFGIVIFVRGFNIITLLLHSELSTFVGVWAMAELLAGALLVFGLFTQWTLLFLVGAMWQYGDVVLLKGTLGNDVAAMLSLLLFMVNAGKFSSLDALALLPR
jgi:hypothetical protein